VTLFPRGRYLPVHCCCEPAKRLGWMPDRYRFRWRVQVSPASLTLWPPSAAGERTAPTFVDIEVAMLALDDHEVIRAVKSNEIPIEVWRTVPGFIEDPTR
jgi:hypothetical protein